MGYVLLSPSRKALRGLGAGPTDALLSAGFPKGALSDAEQKYIGPMWSGVQSGQVQPGSEGAYAQQIVGAFQSQQGGSTAKALAAGSAAASLAVSVGLAPVMGPLAPVAGFVVGKVVDAFQPRPVPGYDAQALRRAMVSQVAQSCGQGDAQCAADLDALIGPVFDYMGWLKGLDCAVTTTWYGGRKDVDPACDLDPAVVYTNSINNVMPKALEITSKSRLKREIAFLKSVKDVADTFTHDYGMRCTGPACKKQVSGVALKTAFDAGMAVRNGDPNGADIILQAGKQEMDGLSAGLYDTQLATFQQQQAASAQRMADARDALSAQQVASAGGGKTKVVLVALVATAVLASVVVMVNRRK